ncbi:Polyisoprenoid-binding protein YceI [Thiothrix caldifontis]|uniref:Polyisoprenoid-binding protein YceI n=1 Tax=Thiothrix caldifontis TaxID=525918 RepID=A0A1H4GDP8_9GAMM|nr:YceI family protein [Thiothrix caldifontis]SEB07735.1 Polyisoprenoid-binding protein YceI [Thiothrix caldifontis]
MKKALATSLLALGLFAGSTAHADDYTIDTEGMHAFIQFRIQHLGYSWLYGRFDKFSGNFSYDEAKPEAAKVEVTIDTTSVNSNHAERDKHLSSEDFLDVAKFPEAKFVSTKYSSGKLEGNLTLHGVTKPITIDVKEIGAGADPWGGFRRGFEGSTKFALADFGIEKDLGPASKEVEMILSIEGVKK